MDCLFILYFLKILCVCDSSLKLTANYSNASCDTFKKVKNRHMYFIWSLGILTELISTVSSWLFPLSQCHPIFELCVL